MIAGASIRVRRWPRAPIVYLAVCLALVAGVAAYVVYGFQQFAKNVGGAVVHALYFEGAYGASLVVSVAKAQGISYGEVTLQDVSGRYPSAHWLAADVASSSVSSLSVSVLAAQDHVIAAVDVGGGQCSWGLAVGSESDPIVATDHLRQPTICRDRGSLLISGSPLPRVRHVRRWPSRTMSPGNERRPLT